jgi:4-hydroxythreonine-4-phosphate dehydrogenase
VPKRQLSRGRPEARRPAVLLIEAPTSLPSRRLHLGGYQSGWAIETATRLVLRRLASGLVTGPISKENLMAGGYRFPGHTEFLAALSKRPRNGPRSKSPVLPPVTMMLANEQLRVSLVTIHTPLKKVPRTLTRSEVHRAITQTADHLRRWWGITRPRIAVAGLNPHAGENGVLGDEEIRTISPVVRALQKRWGSQVELIGPLSADTLFAKHVLAPPAERYDAVVCMYHDQGLIPVKLLDFKNTVNVTLGLPFVRTSVDHGVGFDIAWQDRADPSSFKAAVRLAARIS